MLNIEELLEKHEEEYLKFDKVKEKKTNRPDLQALLILDSIIPSNRDIISASEHDEFFLDIDLEVLAAKATEEQIIDLIRCGVRYS
jgi:hypothetical protein